MTAPLDTILPAKYEAVVPGAPMDTLAPLLPETFQPGPLYVLDPPAVKDPLRESHHLKAWTKEVFAGQDSIVLCVEDVDHASGTITLKVVPNADPPE